jgi:hypothetical protein
MPGQLWYPRRAHYVRAMPNSRSPFSATRFMLIYEYTPEGGVGGPCGDGVDESVAAEVRGEVIAGCEFLEDLQEGLDMLDANCACPSMTTSSRLDGLGVQVPGARSRTGPGGAG